MVHSPISAYVGHSTTLPCWLSPPRSTETLDIHWYHSDHPDASILMHPHYETSHGPESKFFQGRVSFGNKDAESAGLTSGDVSLQLLNVTLKDAGEYTCHVSNDKDYDLGSITLAVLSKYQEFQPMILLLSTSAHLLASFSTCATRNWRSSAPVSGVERKQISECQL